MKADGEEHRHQSVERREQWSVSGPLKENGCQNLDNHAGHNGKRKQANGKHENMMLHCLVSLYAITSSDEDQSEQSVSSHRC